MTNRYTIKKPAGDTIVQINEDGTLTVTINVAERRIVRLFDNPYLEDMDTLHTSLQKWRDGEVIQDAFPGSSVNFREALVNPLFGLTSEEQQAHFFNRVPMTSPKKISLEETGCVRCGETEDMSEFSDLCGYCEHMAEKTINDV